MEPLSSSNAKAPTPAPPSEKASKAARPRAAAASAAAATETDHQLHLGEGFDQDAAQQTIPNAPFIFQPFLPLVSSLAEALREPDRVLKPWPKTWQQWLERVKVVPRPPKKVTAGAATAAPQAPDLMDELAEVAKSYTATNYYVLMDGRPLVLGWNYMPVAVIPETQGKGFRRFILHPTFAHQTPDPWHQFVKRGTSGSIGYLRHLRDVVLFKLAELLKSSEGSATPPLQTTFLSEDSIYPPSLVFSSFVAPSTKGNAAGSEAQVHQVPPSAVTAYDKACVPLALRRVQEGDLMAPVARLTVAVLRGDKYACPQVSFDWRLVKASVAVNVAQRSNDGYAAALTAALSKFDLAEPEVFANHSSADKLVSLLYASPLSQMGYPPEAPPLDKPAPAPAPEAVGAGAKKRKDAHARIGGHDAAVGFAAAAVSAMGAEAPKRHRPAVRRAAAPKKAGGSGAAEAGAPAPPLGTAEHDDAAADQYTYAGEYELGTQPSTLSESAFA